MNGLRLFILLAFVVLSGCLVELGPPEIQGRCLGDAWSEERTAPGSVCFASRSPEAEVRVLLWPRDPYGPILVKARNLGAAVLDLRIDPAEGQAVSRIGDVRLIDADGRYSPDRAPRDLRFRDVIGIPPHGEGWMDLLGKPIFGHACRRQGIASRSTSSCAAQSIGRVCRYASRSTG